MRNLTNVTDYDILFANHSRHIARVNRSQWMLSVDERHLSSRPNAHIVQSVFRLAGATAVTLSLLLGTGRALASVPRSADPDCDDRSCSVVTSADHSGPDRDAG